MLPEHLTCRKPTSIPCLPIVVNRYQRLIKPVFPLIGLMSINPGVCQGKNIFIHRDLISEYSVAPTTHLQNDLRLCPLLHACPIWSHLLWDHLLPCYAYHLIALDKYPPIHIYDDTPISHLVNHYLPYENQSLPEMDSLGKEWIPPSHLRNRTH